MHRIVKTRTPVFVNEMRETKCSVKATAALSVKCYAWVPAALSKENAAGYHYNRVTNTGNVIGRYAISEARFRWYM